MIMYDRYVCTIPVRDGAYQRSYIWNDAPKNLIARGEFVLIPCYVTQGQNFAGFFETSFRESKLL